MINKIKVFSIGLLVMLVSCTNSTTDKLSVVSTTGMINDVVLNIGGDHIEAIGLMGPGVDPHLYKASEGDVRRLSQADLILYNGLHLEAKMGDVLETLSSKKNVLEVTRAIPRDRLMASSDYEGLSDPHVWFDVELWVMIIDDIRDALITLDPDHKLDYELNAEKYKKSLQELDDWVEEQVATIPVEDRSLVTAHDAFGYFGQAYDFQVRGLQGISTESEAGAKDVIELASYISQNQLKAIFVESSISEKNIKAVKAAVASNGWDVTIGGELFSDALGDQGSPEGTYIGMVKHNVITIVEALK